MKIIESEYERVDWYEAPRLGGGFVSIFYNFVRIFEDFVDVFLRFYN